MKKHISKFHAGNLVLLPISAALLDGTDCEFTEHITARDGSKPTQRDLMHTWAQDMADRYGLCPLDGFAYQYPGTDFGGENAPFTTAGPVHLRGSSQRESEARTEAFILAMRDMGIDVRGYGVAGNPDGTYDVATSLDYDGATPNDWHGPFLVRGKMYGGDHETTVMVMLGAHSDDCGDGDIKALSLWLAVPETQYLLGDGYGVYVPQAFVENYLCLALDKDATPLDIQQHGGLRGLECTDDGTAMCEWVPGTYRHAGHGGAPSERGHVLDFYAEPNVDTLWTFDHDVLGDIRDVLTGHDCEHYWESWQNLEERLHVRMEIEGLLCDGSDDVASYTGSLVQDGDLWLVFEPTR